MPGDDEELLRDPEVRNRYRGSIDPADVLRWRADPSALGSDGSRSPVVRAAELGPLIYGRADTPERMRQRDAAAAEAEALLTGWEADSAALDAALGMPATPEPQLQRPRRAADRRRPVFLIAVGAVAVAVLVGLVVLVQPRGTAEVAATPSSTARPTATPSSSPSPTPTAAPTSAPPPPVVVAPAPAEPEDFRPDYWGSDIVTVLEVPLNGGPIDNANGIADVDPYGVPLSYVVADGDVFELIAKRFDLSTSYLAGINAVRRENPTELFVGDTLNLGASTILRIGDQNGVVYNFTDRLPDPHVPQD